MANPSDSDRPIITEYDDYRKFLGSFYNYLKKNRRGFSFRTFSRDAGFSSPNFLKLVIEGKRNLTSDSIHRFAQALRFTKAESEFFEILVHFNQATSLTEKNNHFEKMRKVKRFRELRSLDTSQFDYYSHWYHVAIRELTNLKDFQETPEWIAQKLLPKITPRQAEESLELLQEIKMLKRDSRGRLKPADSLITTGAEVRSLAVMNFHKHMLKQAEEALDAVPSLERDVSSATLTVRESDLEKIKARLVRFRRELLASFDVSDAMGERVYQIGIQLFPLSQRNRGTPS